MRSYTGVLFMKVTVCFGAVKVVVPCADGSLSVSDLKDKAVARYLKAAGRPRTHWVHVQKLIASSDGGILHPSDRLRDVVDDRDQIIAIFEEHTSAMRQNSGEGTSTTSSMSASSPDMFPDDHFDQIDTEEEDFKSKIKKNGVLISSQDVIIGSKLMVRRGSEPVIRLKKSATKVSSNNNNNSNSNNNIRENISGLCHSLNDHRELDSDSGVSGSDTADRKKSQSQERNDDNAHQGFPCKDASDVQRSVPLRITPPSLDTSKDLPCLARPERRNVESLIYSSSEELSGSVPGETRAVPPPVPPRRNLTPALAIQNSVASGRTNTRLLGKRIVIQLIKGPLGLGFSVTTRDNPAGGNCPIYIKNIMPRGAAVETGQLQIGDRLLQVNDVELTGKSQTEVVSILRGLAEGSTVDLVISRQEILETNIDQLQQNVSTDNLEHGESLPASEFNTLGVETPSGANTNGFARVNDVEILVFDVHLNSGGIQGLGITLKGKTILTPSGIEDHGIFLKSVIPGGAAFKDGNLQPNDQFCEVNGEILLYRSNLDAINALHSAIQKNSSKSRSVKVIIARKRKTPDMESSSAMEASFSSRVTEPDRHISLCGDAQNGLRIPSSHSLHNLSYQQAISDAVLQEILPSLGPKDSGDRDLASLAALNAKQNIPEANCHMYQIPTASFATPTATKFLSSKVAGISGDEKDRSSSEIFDWDCKNSDVTQDISSSDTESRPAFQREGFGRQSMSEKRKGHLDPRTSEVYQKIKQNKRRCCSASLDRQKSKDRSDKGGEDKRPSPGRKMSTSLESLTAAFQEAKPVPGSEAMKEKAADKQSRLRGTNNSFRAAVDRSYDNDFDPDDDDDDDDDVPVKGVEAISFFADEADSRNERSLISKDSEEAQMCKKDKSSSRFKGLGGILRFGKNKKTDGRSGDGRPGDAGREETKLDKGEVLSYRDRVQSPVETDRRCEKPSTETSISLPVNLGKRQDALALNLGKRQDALPVSLGRRQDDTQTQCKAFSSNMSQLMSTSAPAQGEFGQSVNPLDMSVHGRPATRKIVSSSASNRLMQLRQEHQRHHRERDHQYPLDAEAEKYEQHLQEEEHQMLLMEKEKLEDLTVVQYRARNEIPGSRIPYVERPMSFGNDYQNIDIIRSQLQLYDSYQLRYKTEARQQQDQQHILQQQFNVQKQFQPQQPLQKQNLLPCCQVQQPLSTDTRRQQLLSTNTRRQQPLSTDTRRNRVPILHQYSRSYSSHLSTNSYLISQEPAANENQELISGLFGKQGCFDDNRSYNWNQSRAVSQSTLQPSCRVADQKTVDYNQYYPNQQSHAYLPLPFGKVLLQDTSPRARLNDNEPGLGVHAQRSERRDHYYHH